MAVAPKDIPVHRGQVQQWIDDYPGGDLSLESYIRGKIVQLNLPDRMVRTPNGDVDIADLVVSDLRSYVLPNP